MRLMDVVKAEKSAMNARDWAAGEIPRSLWPSKKAKPKAYKIGPAYQWRIVSFHTLGHDWRVRILLNVDKHIFRATLGVHLKGEMVVVCEYEFHASEPGWHCHARCEEVSTLDPATNRAGSRRIPSARTKHRDIEFRFKKAELTTSNALNCAADFFGLDKTGGGL